MDLEQSRDWLSLAQQPYQLISEFLKQHQTIQNLDIGNWLKSHHCQINHSKLKHSLAWLKLSGHHLLSYPEFPESLKSINSPPAVLFLSGDPTLLGKPQLAIVGSRKPTPGGRENARYFASNLAKSGLTILSGLANGIDGIAHQSALGVTGKTIAVLGCGHLTCYPKSHKSLYLEIESKGLIISEFPPHTPVRAYQFPRRNRIISGLSLGVLVIEAAIKSGSLITCRLAADQGREVFAIPGDITNPLSRGCHYLIQNGAYLVETPADIIQELDIGILPSRQTQLDFLPENLSSEISSSEIFSSKSLSSKSLSSDEQDVLNNIDRHSTSVDKLLERTSLKRERLLRLLFNLEIKKFINRTVGGYFKVTL